MAEVTGALTNLTQSTTPFDNSTEHYTIDLRDDHVYDTVVRVFVEVTIVLLSLVGNILIIVTILSGRIRLTSTHMLFISLAISDLLLAILGQGFYLVDRIEQLQIGDDEFYCKIGSIVKSAIILSSNTLALITIERVLCVTIPHKVKLICNKKVAIAQLLVLWIFFTLYCAFHFVKSGIILFEGQRWCGFILLQEQDTAYAQFYIVFNSAVTFVFPFATNVLGTVIILFGLRRRMRSFSTQSRATTVILINTNIVFVITQLPFAVWQYLQSDVIFILTDEQTFYIHTVVSYLSMFSCALNFFVYFLSGRYFRQAVINIIINCFKSCRIKE